MIHSLGYQKTVKETGEPSENKGAGSVHLSSLMEEVGGLSIYFCNERCMYSAPKSTWCMVLFAQSQGIKRQYP